MRVYAFDVPFGSPDRQAPSLLETSRAALTSRSLVVALAVAHASVASVFHKPEQRQYLSSVPIARATASRLPMDRAMEDVRATAEHRESALTPEHVTKPQSIYYDALEPGISLVNKPFLFKVKTANGGERNIACIIIRNEKNDTYTFMVNGKTYLNRNTIPLTEISACGAIDTMIVTSNKDTQLISEEYGTAEIPYALLQEMIPTLADSENEEVRKEVQVRFTPNPKSKYAQAGTTASNLWSGALSLIGAKPNPPEVVFKRIRGRQ